MTWKNPSIVINQNWSLAIGVKVTSLKRKACRWQDAIGLKGAKLVYC